MTGLFIPESLTPLAYTPLYRHLGEEHRISYNRLHGQYFLEQTIFFEQVMGRPVLETLERIAPEEELRLEIRRFLAEENTHTGWFRSLLREVRPPTSDDRDFALLAAPSWGRSMMRLATRSVRRVPALLWLQLIAEERAVYFGREFLAVREQLDPRFLEVQQRHLADEIGHVRSDERLLHWLWPSTAPWLRRANAGLLEWSLREFFHLPKRSGWRVVDVWIRQHPELERHRGAIRREWHGLAGDAAYCATLYPKRHLTRTLALAGDWPELSFLGRFFTD